MPLNSNFNAAQKSAPDLLKDAVIHNDPETVRRFLQQGVNPNQADIDKTTLLMLAAGKGHTRVARLLIEGGALLDEKNKHGTTALMLAAALNHAETVRLLVDKGADLDLTNCLGVTALDFAKNNRYTKIIYLLEEEPEIRRRVAEEQSRAAAAEKERLRHEHVSAKQQWLKEKARKRPRL